MTLLAESHFSDYSCSLKLFGIVFLKRLVSSFGMAIARDDDDTIHLGFEVQRDYIKPSAKTLAYQSTPRSSELNFAILYKSRELGDWIIFLAKSHL